MTEEETIARNRVRNLLKQGVYHQDDLFARVYPEYNGHYSKLREIIHQEKHYA